MCLLHHNAFLEELSQALPDLDFKHCLLFGGDKLKEVSPGQSGLAVLLLPLLPRLHQTPLNGSVSLYVSIALTEVASVGLLSLMWKLGLYHDGAVSLDEIVARLKHG